MELLNELVATWKEKPQYKDVAAKYLVMPSDDQMLEKCPNGCDLVIHKLKQDSAPWREMIDLPDYFRQTRFCKKHGFARIYVTTGLDALRANYNLE